MPLRAQSGLSGLVTPAVSTLPSAGAAGLAGLRVLVGLMWLYNVVWKRPPDFGEDSGTSVYGFSQDAVEYPVFPPYSWLVENLVLPSFPAFGWMVLVVETMLAVLLLTGTLVRLAALVGVAQSLAIGLSVAQTPGEWPWSYWLMIGAHGLLLVSSAGRVFAVDAVRARLAPARSIALPWGLIAVVVGAVSILRSLDDPTAARGPGLRSTDLSVSLGEYNLVGGVVLAAAGVLLLVATSRAVRGAAWVGAVVAVIGGLSLHAQIGFSDPLLGGTATSAAVLFSVALVAVTVAAARSPQMSTPVEDTRVPTEGDTR